MIVLTGLGVIALVKLSKTLRDLDKVLKVLHDALEVRIVFLVSVAELWVTVELCEQLKDFQSILSHDW